MVRPPLSFDVHQPDCRKIGKNEKVLLSLMNVPCNAMDRSQETKLYSDKSWYGMSFHVVSNRAGRIQVEVQGWRSQVAEVQGFMRPGDT